MNKELLSKVSIDTLIKVAAREKYNIFTNDSKDANLNIWIIRSNNQQAGKFDDIQFVFWKYNAKWSTKVMACTADPSDLSLITMNNRLGCGIISKGQWKSCWEYGKHKGYDALVQVKPILIVRDFNRDNILDYHLRGNYEEKRNYVSQGGLVTDYYDDNNKLIYRTHNLVGGFNNHRASKWKLLDSVGLYSEGCIVIQNPYEYEDYMSLCRESRDTWGNKFTITVIHESDLI